VVSRSTAATDGVDLSARCAVDRNLAPVLTVSFGECERDLGQAGVAFYRDLWAQAAAMGNGYLIQTGGWPSLVGGTSCSAPAFAGIMALVVQHAGRQGNILPALYRLGSAQYAAGGPKVFHDIVQGGSDVPGTPGYPATAGYDLATGLGSLDAQALVDHVVVPGGPR